jgi:hypothetical protein
VKTRAAVAQDPTTVTPPSGVTVTQTSVSILFLVDGKGQGNLGIAYPLATFAGTGGRLKFNAVTAYGLGATPNTEVYMGVGFSYLLYQNKYGYALTGFAIWKGLNMTGGFEPAPGMKNGAIGIAASLPFK